MTFTISVQAWHDLQQEVNATAQHDPLDLLDVIWQIPKVVGHGYMRWIELRDRFNAAVNICNLFDTFYYTNAIAGRFYILLGAPFTIVGSVSWEF